MKLKLIVLPLTVTLGAPTGARVELSDGQGKVVLRFGAVVEQILVHPATVVEPAPATILAVLGLRVTETLLATEGTGAAVQAMVMVPRPSAVP